MGFLKDSQFLTPGPPSSVTQIPGFRTLQITLKLLQLQVLLIPMGALSPVKTCSGEHFVHSRGSIGNLHLIQPHTNPVPFFWHVCDVHACSKCVHVAASAPQNLMLNVYLDHSPLYLY